MWKEFIKISCIFRFSSLEYKIFICSRMEFILFTKIQNGKICQTYRLQMIFGAGNPSARHVMLIFWFSRTATDDAVLSISNIFGGTANFQSFTTINCLFNEQNFKQWNFSDSLSSTANFLNYFILYAGFLKSTLWLRKYIPINGIINKRRIDRKYLVRSQSNN